MATVGSVEGAAGTLPGWAKEEWKTAFLRVTGTAPALRLWHRVLTEGDRRRLGGDLEKAYARFGSAVGMWRHLRGVSVYRAVVDVGVRVGFLDASDGRALLRVIGEESDDPEEAMEAAAAAGALVLAEGPRRAFWEGEEVPIEWAEHTSMWELLWALARASKAGAAVDAHALQDRHEQDPGFVRKRKCRLVNAPGFPLSLADLVVSAGRGAYRLNLSPALVRVFERGAGESLREWTP